MSEFDGKPEDVERPTGERPDDSHALDAEAPAHPEDELRQSIAEEMANPPEITIPEAAPTVPPVATVEATAAPVRAPRTVLFARLVQALWLGGGVFLALAALAVFRTLAAPDAADAVGAMLSRWHYIAVLAPAILMLVEWRRQRSRMVILLFLAVIVAVLQLSADLRIRRMRLMSPVPISSLDRSDPIRRRFGAMHGFSSFMLLAQIVAAIGVVAAEPDPDE